MNPDRQQETMARTLSDSSRRLSLAILGHLCTLCCMLATEAGESSSETKNGLQLSGDWGYINVGLKEAKCCISDSAFLG